MLLFILKVLWDAKSAFRELKGDFSLLWPSTPLGKRLGREVADLVFCLVHETAVVKECMALWLPACRWKPQSTPSRFSLAWCA